LPLVNIDEHIDRVLAELDKKEPPKQRTDGVKRGRKKTLPANLRNMLYLTGDKPGDYPSRSELLWAFLCEALRVGLSDDNI
jgi:hypothetical protein